VDRHSVHALGDGWFLVDDGNRRVRVAVASDANGTWVFTNGQVARLDSGTQAPSASRRRSPGAQNVMSPMPATVVAIHAVAGQTVTEGETIIVLEAMKMELPIKAPRSGVVKTVHCAKGDLVQPGVNLLELE
jgi:3-methylcrotonyl-CoA carboxylase alpha subunit